MFTAVVSLYCQFKLQFFVQTSFNAKQTSAIWFGILYLTPLFWKLLYIYIYTLDVPGLVAVKLVAEAFIFESLLFPAITAVISDQ